MKNIKELINNIPICDDGKKSVAELIKYIMPSADLIFPAIGEVWLTNSERIVIVTNDSGIVQIDDIFPFFGSDTEGRKLGVIGTNFNPGYNIFNSYWKYKIANTPYEYFKNRDAILAEMRQKFPKE